MAEAVLFRGHGLMVAQGDLALVNKKSLAGVWLINFGTKKDKGSNDD